MIKRSLTPVIKRAASQFPVITLTGPRQSGKTTLLRSIFSDKPYVSLEDPDVRQRFLSDPRGMLTAYTKGAFFDEFQRVPELPSYLQRFVDETNEPGRFILSGSQQLEVMNTVSQSLAGRTAVLKLLPLSMEELQSKADGYSDDALLINGFYPRLYDHGLDADLMYKSYVQTYLERDLNQLIHVKDLSQFQRFLTLCASRVGQLFVASHLANEVGVSVNTIQSWISILQASFIVYLLPPFYANIRKRVVKTPKLYFYDVGLASYLLDIHTPEQIRRDPLRGSLFENMVIMDAFKNALNLGKKPNFFFYRDQSQTEMDLMIQRGRVYDCIEIKSGQTFHSDMIKSFRPIHSALGEMMGTCTLVYAGTESFSFEGMHVENWRSWVRVG